MAALARVIAGLRPTNRSGSGSNPAIFVSTGWSLVARGGLSRRPMAPDPNSAGVNADTAGAAAVGGIGADCCAAQPSAVATSIWLAHRPWNNPRVKSMANGSTTG